MVGEEEGWGGERRGGEGVVGLLVRAGEGGWDGRWWGWGDGQALSKGMAGSMRGEDLQWGVGGWGL